VSFSAFATTPCATTFASSLRGPRFLPLGQPPSLALRLAARALAFEVALPSREPMLISFPQCGHCMPEFNPTVSYVATKFQSSPLPKNPVKPWVSQGI